MDMRLKKGKMKNWYKKAEDQLSLFPEEFPEKIKEEIKPDKPDTIFLFNGASYYPYGFSTVRFFIGSDLWEYTVGNDIAYKIENMFKGLSKKNVTKEDASRLVYDKFIPQNKRNEVKIDRITREPIRESYKEFDRSSLI